MNVHFGTTTRGRGRIFIHVEVDGLPQGASLMANATTKTFDVIPVAVLTPKHVEGWVLMLPIFEVTQLVDVCVCDVEGRELLRRRKTVASFSTKACSKINTAMHNPIVDLIRNCDTRERNLRTFVNMDELMEDSEDGVDVIHGHIMTISDDREAARADLTLSTLGPQATDVSSGSCLFLEDEISCEDGVFRREVAFSVRVPQDVAQITFWVRSESPSIQEAFFVCEDKHLATVRQDWRNWATSAEANPTYHQWFLTHGRVPTMELEAHRSARFEIEPMFSIVVPLYRTPLNYLQELVESVLWQSYGRFELILVNASPDEESLRVAVRGYAERDERIRVCELDRNEGISRNTLLGVDMATGDFVSFLDHDDVIEEDLLYQYVKGINEHADTDLLYCDEDKLCDGRYNMPFFKPDWNPDLLCSENYVCHMLTVRREIVEQMPRDGYVQCEGAQDHFLTLFAGERARYVFHARRILYHWRVHPQSTSANIEAKSYTTDAGVLAVQAHLDRCGIPATAAARGLVPNTYQTNYELKDHPLVSIVIPNKDEVAVLDRCVRSILDKSTYDYYEIVIVENNSTESSTFTYYEQVSRDARVRVAFEETDGTFNFSRTINFGAAHARGEYLLLLNNDTEVITPDWIERMVGICQREGTGIVGVKLLYPDGLVQHAGVAVLGPTGPVHIGRYRGRNSRAYFNTIQLTQNYSAVTAACLMISKQLFDAVGGMDESLPVDYNDVDLCLRVRAARQLVVYEPLVELYHYESVSRGQYDSESKKMGWAKALGTIMQRWPKAFGLCDPYWHPQLTHSGLHQLF